jgi:hypothetical protein
MPHHPRRMLRRDGSGHVDNQRCTVAQKKKIRVAATYLG